MRPDVIETSPFGPSARGDAPRGGAAARAGRLTTPRERNACTPAVRAHCPSAAPSDFLSSPLDDILHRRHSGSSFEPSPDKPGPRLRE